MQGKFENDVQRKLDELRLQPSAPVWEKIEIEIRPEKRRRRGIVWFLFAAGLVAGGGWWLFTGSDKPLNIHHPPADKVVASRIKPQEQPALQKGSSISSRAESKNENPEVAPTGPTANNSGIPASFNRANAIAPTKNSVATNTDKPLHTIENLPEQKQPAGKLLMPATKDVTITEGISSQQKLPVKKAATKPAAIDTFSATEITKQQEATPDTVTANNAPGLPLQAADSVTKKKVASVKRRRIRFGFDLGWNNLLDRSSFSPVARDVLAFYSSGSSASTNASLQSVSARTRGKTFSVGAAFTHFIGSRWELQAGLNYRFASLPQKVGEKKSLDTTFTVAQDRVAVQDVYTNSSAHNYSNNFHYLELPVNLSYKLVKGWPVYLSAGAMYGRLFSTNALSFSSSANLYFKNSAAFQRNALSLSTSLQASLFAKQKVSVRTGPFVQYNLLGVEKANGSNLHFFYTGLRTALIF